MENFVVAAMLVFCQNDCPAAYKSDFNAVFAFLWPCLLLQAIKNAELCLTRLQKSVFILTEGQLPENYELSSLIEFSLFARVLVPLNSHQMETFSIFLSTNLTSTHSFLCSSY